MVGLVRRPRGAIVGKQRKNAGDSVKVKVVDEHSEKNGGEDATLRNTSNGSKPIGEELIVSDAEEAIGKKCTQPSPSFARDRCLSEEFVE